jgi:hypothetical protein
MNKMLLFLFVVLVATACERAKDVEYATFYTYHDSIYFEKAEKLSQWDTTLTRNIKGGDEYVLAPANQKVIFKGNDVLKVRYLGGYVNEGKHIYPTVEAHGYGSNVVVDTVYLPYPRPHTYALFELELNGEVYLDTVIYDNLLPMASFHTGIYNESAVEPYMDFDSISYLNLVSHHLDSLQTTMSNEQYSVLFDSLFHAIKLPNDKRKIYVMDICPAWHNNPAKRNVLFFIKK